MTKIQIKPLSVNKAWRGKRYKTQDYLNYENLMLLFLPNGKVRDGNLQVEIEFGFSNSKSDIDNGLKPFLDILQKKYKFDDCQIVKLIVDKVKVGKGEDYVAFKIIEL